MLWALLSACARKSEPVAPEIESGWSVQYRSEIMDVSALFFIDSLRGWVGGSGGAIIRTTDGGATWQPQSSGVNNMIADIFFLDAGRGWAVAWDKRILATEDGGRHWSIQLDNRELGGILQSVFFTDPLNGWSVGRFPTFRSSDGGGNWSYTPASDAPDDEFARVFFSDRDHGWIVGRHADYKVSGRLEYAAMIMRTLDGGTTWDTTIMADLWGLDDVWFVDSNVGWAVGADHTILHSTDGGATWRKQFSEKSDFATALEDVHFVDRLHGWATGETLGDHLLATTDGGTTWRAQPTGRNDRYRRVFFTDATRGWAAGINGVILHTTNGGFAP